MGIFSMSAKLICQEQNSVHVCGLCMLSGVASVKSQMDESEILRYERVLLTACSSNAAKFVGLL